MHRKIAVIGEPTGRGVASPRMDASIAPAAQPASLPAPVPVAPLSLASRTHAQNPPSPALIARIAAGDQAALEELYDCTAAKLLGLARWIVKNAEDAEEVVCDVYLQLWQAPSRYDCSRGSVLAWMLGICRSRAIDRCRRNRSRVAPANSDPDSDDSDFGCEPSDLLQQLEQGSAIRRALEQLSPIRRRLLVLAYFRGLSHKEIAVETHLPIGTVKSHIRRALALLRTELGQAAAMVQEPRKHQIFMS